MVEQIKKGGDTLKLVVISVSLHEAEKFDSDSSSGNEYYDYSDKRVAPLSIPETRQVTSRGESYLVRLYIHDLCSWHNFCISCSLHTVLVTSFPIEFIIT